MSRFRSSARAWSPLLLSLLLSLLSFLAACGGGASTPTPPPPPYVSLSILPDPLTIYPSTSFTLKLTATTNTGATPSLTSVSLPCGLTTTSTFPLSVPTGGVSITFQTPATITATTCTLTFAGTAGPATKSKDVIATVQTNPPAFYFLGGLFSEIGIPFGASGEMQFSTRANTGDGQAYYDVQLSLAGLPPGTTATISPQTVRPGQSTTVTITASSGGPISQNATVTLTGTPSAPVSAASISFLVDVTPPPGSLPVNRADYVSTDETAYGAVYDSVHNLIFASNPSWSRVDVISTTTHALVARIPIREPRGIDLSQDRSTVWLASDSRQVFAINTISFAVSRYLLPVGLYGDWAASTLAALSDGTLMIGLSYGNTGISSFAIWDPATNAIKFPNPNNRGGMDAFFRSGNGKRVYFLAGDSGGAAYSYDVPTKKFSSVTTLGGYALSAAVNVDGSRIVICDANGPNMYDGNFNLVGPVPGCGFGAAPFFEGGSVFSEDNRFLYQEVLSSVPVIIKIDANTLDILSLAPAMPLIPVMTELSSGYYIPTPFAVDGTGMVFGIEDWGIAFDDGAFTQNFSPSQPGSPTFMQHMDPYFGPVSGGTTSGGFGNVFALTPDVWYGGARGTATNTSNAITIKSPPASVAGPVNIKMLFPDGVEVFAPLFFSFGPSLQFTLQSGAPPQGNAPAQVIGYGLPGDGVSGTLTVGGAVAAVQPPGNLGLPFAGTPYPNKVLTYTVPPGVPGVADITLTTPDGKFTLPKAMFYAHSVADYPSTDPFAAVLYDGKRDQLYLSAGDHIDVFSLTSKTFGSPISAPAVQGTVKLFAGLALTPDGSHLLATDLADGSVAVIDPDTPSNSFAFAVAPVSNNGCYIGPLYVAPASNDKAFVITGAMPGPFCGLGKLFLVDLASHTAGPPPASGDCTLSYALFPSHVAATEDGGKVAIGGTVSYGGFCIYDVASNSYTSASAYQLYGAAISGDGNVAASEFVLTDSSSTILGRIARPPLYYAPNDALPNLPEPRFNATGSLYFIPFANFFDIVDVQHAILRMRFSLSETISNIPVSLATDPEGRLVFLITNKGLTIVDLGEAPLSIGWLNPENANPGTQVTLRGSGFSSSTSATIAGQAATVVFIDPSTLTVTIPTGISGSPTIVLTNPQGITYTAAGLLTIH